MGLTPCFFLLMARMELPCGSETSLLHVKACLGLSVKEPASVVKRTGGHHWKPSPLQSAHLERPERVV